MAVKHSLPQDFVNPQPDLGQVVVSLMVRDDKELSNAAHFLEERTEIRQ